jgi:hypothetical protein
MRKRIKIERGRTEGRAWCESCDLLNAAATRERARQHADVLQHVTHYVVRDITTYYPTGDSSA